MSISFAQIVIECNNAGGLASSGRPVEHGANPYFATVGRSADPPLRSAWKFVKVPQARIGKNRVHADLTSADWAAEVERALGATRVAEFGTRWVTETDPGATSSTSAPEWGEARLDVREWIVKGTNCQPSGVRSAVGPGR